MDFIAFSMISSMLKISNFSSGVPLSEIVFWRTVSTNLPNLSFSLVIVDRNLFFMGLLSSMFSSLSASQANPIVAIGVFSSWVMLLMKSDLI